jgi:hypothetical protein
MIALYLLDHPDHYTNEEFTSFFWPTFVNHALDDFTSDEGNKPVMESMAFKEKLSIQKVRDKVVRVAKWMDGLYPSS